MIAFENGDTLPLPVPATTRVAAMVLVAPLAARPATAAEIAVANGLAAIASGSGTGG